MIASWSLCYCRQRVAAAMLTFDYALITPYVLARYLREAISRCYHATEHTPCTRAMMMPRRHAMLDFRLMLTAMLRRHFAADVY